MLVLIRDFQIGKGEATVKEFVVNVTKERYAIKFEPAKGSTAFVNAIEFVTIPAKMLDYSVPVLFPVSQKFDLSKSNFETMYRLNVGGVLLWIQLMILLDEIGCLMHNFETTPQVKRYLHNHLLLIFEIIRRFPIDCSTCSL